MSWHHLFPALQAQPHGQRLAFLDSAASAQKPHAVLTALTQTLSGPYANIHRGLYHNSAVTTQAYEDARATLARFLGAPANSLIFTRNSTESINLVAQTWGRQNLTAKSVVTLSEVEHHANIVPWQLLQSEIGFTIRVIPATTFLQPTTYNLQPLLQGTTLLALTQMSNVTGLKPDLTHIIPLAKQHGAHVLIDGSQGAVHSPQNLTQLGADFYTLTGHKLYGPTGIGLLYARPEILATMPPYQGGGDMIEQVTLPTGTTFAPPPARFEAGTPAIAEAIGLAAAAQFVESLGWPAITKLEHSLATHLTEALSSLPFIQTYSPAATGIAAFNVKGCHPADIATLLDQQGVAVRSGHHCAMPYMKALGIEGCLRASIALYNTEEDITQLTTALTKAHKMLT
ncbi:MAG: aminotransferase class V-fold PLP-dependent enzyme [Proteobacteria bacterium]|nr:aminotransferase class V-fold PLP-dependent enzyme [Pseudomonadota bacterium]